MNVEARYCRTCRGCVGMGPGEHRRPEDCLRVLAERLDRIDRALAREREAGRFLTDWRTGGVDYPEEAGRPAVGPTPEWLEGAPHPAGCMCPTCGDAGGAR